jgi:hypothetical protein
MRNWLKSIRSGIDGTSMELSTVRVLQIPMIKER